jgi:hypothetical protein
MAWSDSGVARAIILLSGEASMLPRRAALLYFLRLEACRAGEEERPPNSIDFR